MPSLEEMVIKKVPHKKSSEKKFKKIIKILIFSVYEKKTFFCWIFFSYFLLTSAFGHPHPPTSLLT